MSRPKFKQGSAIIFFVFCEHCTGESRLKDYLFNTDYCCSEIIGTIRSDGVFYLKQYVEYCHVGEYLCDCCKKQKKLAAVFGPRARQSIIKHFIDSVQTPKLNL